jgi:hypothetical protein
MTPQPDDLTQALSSLDERYTPSQPVTPADLSELLAILDRRYELRRRTFQPTESEETT